MPEEPNNNQQPDVGTPEVAAERPVQAVKVEPTVQSAAQTVSTEKTAAIASSPKPKKKMIIGIIAAAIVVILGGSAYATYSWYQAPQKVVTDSLISAAMAKNATLTGVLSVDNEQAKVEVEIDAKGDDKAGGSFNGKITITAEGKTYSLKGGVIYVASGDIYFKVENLEGIVTMAKNYSGLGYDDTASTAIDKIVEKIDGTWIKISNDDLKEFSDDTSKSKSCMDDIVKKYKDDSAAAAEITDAYKKNEFINIDKELGEKNGSLGYQIKGDEAKFEAFAKDIEDTKIYKAMHDCDDSFDLTPDTTDSEVDADTEADSDGNGTIEIWIDKWSHQITNIEAKGESDSAGKIFMSIKPKFNQNIEVKAPADSMSITELKTYIEDLITSYNSAYPSDDTYNFPDYNGYDY